MSSPRVGRRGPRKFKYFPKLPKEIRDQIWQMAIPPAQKILIDYKMKGNKVETERNGVYVYVWPEATVALYKVPAMLGTNREARYWAERVYTYSFGDRLGRTNSAGIGIWIDLDRDVLTFANTKALVSFCNVSIDHQFVFSPYDGVSQAEPLPKLRNIGFGEKVAVRPELFTPSFLGVLGKPNNIFNVRKSRYTLLASTIQANVDSRWPSVEASELQYPKPNIYHLQYKSLNAFLVSYPSTPARI